MSKSKDVRDLLRRLSREGAVIVRTRSDHWKITNPTTGQWVILAGTPSTDTSVSNTVSNLRKIGYLSRSVTKVKKLENT